MAQEQIDFRKTLNLPQTSFSMKAGLAAREPRFLEDWATSDLYAQIRTKSQGRPKFFLHDGPPYANGNIHIGHALNKILKDIVVKSKTMQGFDSHYVPGWDCHGLPIEHQLLKSNKQDKDKIDSVAFRKSAHDYAMKYVDIQREQFQRLGVFGDWDNPYLTLDKNYEKWILRSLSELVRDGYVYRGLKPVNWCMEHQTALAEAEIEYEDVTSTTVYARFRVLNPDALGQDLPSGKNVALVIWTTTPWTLVANVAVAVNATFRYSLIELGDDILIMEKSLAPKVLEKAGIEGVRILGEISGEELTQLKYKHPLGMRAECPVVTADYVTKDDGTGLVHTAPGHGPDDFATGKKYNLDVVMPVNERGVYTEEAGKYAGQFIFKANPLIVEDLQSAGDLLYSEPLRHSYPHSWRSKKPVIFRATHQWFIRIDHEGLRGKLKDIITKDVQWIPSAGQERILGMTGTRPDWCISRQRFWGVPIPALKEKVSGDVVLHPEVIDHFAKIAGELGTDAWFEKDLADLLPPGFSATDFEKTFDILDVWFDSGVSHQAVIKGKLGLDLPADLYLEGSDQHRGWFQSSLIPAVAMEGRAPYKAVLTHGFVVDGQGRKMSKSMGNVISPKEIIDKSGADILRLWVAASSYHEDIRLSPVIMDRMVDGYRKIRNTFRYLLGNLYDFVPDSEIVDYQCLPDLDKWALGRLADTAVQMTDGYNRFAFADVYQALYHFCNENLSNFYLDILKDRLYISAAQDLVRKSAQTVLFHVLNVLTRLAAPILVFTAEEVFQAMPQSKENGVASVHLLEWLDVPEMWSNLEIEKQFERLIDLRSHVMKALEDRRREGLIGSPLEAKIIFQTASDSDFVYLNNFGEELADYFVVSQAQVEKVSVVDRAVGQAFPKTGINVVKADGRKCGRSWKYSTDVGKDPDFPELSWKSAQIVKEILHGQ